jgi:hypothetical protein
MGGLKGRCGHRGRRGEHGYILLDVLIAMCIALVGLAVFFGGLGVAARLAVVQGERVRLVVERRNADAKDRAIFFTAR